jgi:hypothetical protein
MAIALVHTRMKWWHWTMLISGSVMIIGGIISIIVL